MARALSHPLLGVVNLPLALASFLFTAAVLGGRSHLPRRLAWASPLLCALLIATPGLAVPHWPPARLAAAASFNLGHLVFFTLVTAALRRPPAAA